MIFLKILIAWLARLRLQSVVAHISFQAELKFEGRVKLKVAKDFREVSLQKKKKKQRHVLGVT